MFPSPHPGIINFFYIAPRQYCASASVSVPSSGDYQFLLSRRGTAETERLVSVPSSGDYQFLLTVTIISFLPRLISSQYANREPHLNFPKNSICRQQLIV